MPTVAAPDSAHRRPRSRRRSRPQSGCPPDRQPSMRRRRRSSTPSSRRLAAWSVVKREFPDWYGEQLRQAAELTAQNQPEARGQQASRRGAGRAAPPARQRRALRQHRTLKDVANAFLNNLKALAEPERRRLLRLHLAGRDRRRWCSRCCNRRSRARRCRRRSRPSSRPSPTAANRRRTHDRAVKNDYDVLVQELTKLGWKEDDLQVFSNPTLLSREPPEPRLPDGAGLVRRAPRGRGPGRRRSACWSRP